MTIQSGDKTVASDVLARLTALTPLFAYKTAAETVNNSATLQDDDRLFVAVAANKVYELMLRLAVNSGATPDFKMQFTYPSGTTMTLHSFEANGTGVSTALISQSFDQTSVRAFSTNGDQTVVVEGLVIVSSTAGNVTLQWAQNTANASDTKVMPGSYLRLTQVA